MVHFKLELSFHLFGRKRQTRTGGMAFIHQKIAEREQQERFKTAENYLTCARSLSAFLETQNWTMEQLDKGLIQRYAEWMHARGLSLNTSACYLKTLRGLYNMAVRECSIEDKRPFDGQFLGRMETRKRSVSEHDIRRLRQLDLSAAPHLALSRDLFLFGVYAMGMPFIDIAYLRRSQLSDTELHYRRHKTGRRVIVSLEPCLRAIIEKYQSRQSGFVFPVLSGAKTEKTLYQQYRNKLRTHNANLARLSQLVGVTLTSYVARHTWATTAYSDGVELPLISKALGHAKPSTTLLYIRARMDPRLAQANQVLLRQFGAE